jgi:hypothetical protein
VLIPKLPMSEEFWTNERLALLGTDTDTAIARLLRISSASVLRARKNQNIPAHRPRTYRWGQTELDLLRSYSDDEIAIMTSRSLAEISAKRQELLK